MARTNKKVHGCLQREKDTNTIIRVMTPLEWKDKGRDPKWVEESNLVRELTQGFVKFNYVL